MQFENIINTYSILALSVLYIECTIYSITYTVISYVSVSSSSRRQRHAEELRVGSSCCLESERTRDI